MKKISLILLFSLFCSALFSQQNQDTIVPKVGLVLSGGGAKGLYHIGVLKALEENNIPIDYITGTSMGAIVAGLYAAGYTPWEMEQITIGPEISRWVSGKLDPKYQSTYNKPEPRPEMFKLAIDVNNLKRGARIEALRRDSNKLVEFYNPSLTKSSDAATAKLISSSQLDIGLMQYFSGANAVSNNNFDSLYVPFRCVSVDAVSKTQRVWKSGELSQAIRASMAIPVVFSPVIVDSAVMFDGGVYNNFPWRETYDEWQPDLIIGSRCTVSDVMDLSSTMGQLMSLIIRPTDYDIPDSLGIQLGRGVDVGILEYNRAKEIIEIGYRDAIKAMPYILSRTPRLQSSVERDLRRLMFKKRIPTLVFDREQLSKELRQDDSVDTTSLRAIKSAERDQKREARRDEKQLKKRQKAKSSEYVDLLDLESFKQIYFQTLEDGDATASFPFANYVDSLGYYDFNTSINRNPKLLLRGGLNISSSSINQFYLGAGYKYNKKNTYFYNVDGYLGAFYNSAQLSNRINFYQGRNKLYVYNTITYNYLNYIKANDQKYSYSEGVLSAKENLNELYVSSTLGFPVGNRSKMETRVALGVDRFYTNSYLIQSEVSEPLKLKTSVNFATLNARFVTSDIDDDNYPTKGFRQEISLGGTILSEKMTFELTEDVVFDTGSKFLASLKYSVTNYFDFGKFMSLGLMAEGVVSNQSNSLSFLSNHFAPRFAPTQYSKTVFLPEFESFSYAAVGVMPVFKVFKNLEVRPEVYAVATDLLTDPSRIKYIFAASAVYKLPFASISLSYNYLDVESAKKNYFMFNFGVMMFNPRGIVY